MARYNRRHNIQSYFTSVSDALKLSVGDSAEVLSARVVHVAILSEVGAPAVLDDPRVSVVTDDQHGVVVTRRAVGVAEDAAGVKLEGVRHSKRWSVG
jgi:hypothetical protein